MREPPYTAMRPACPRCTKAPSDWISTHNEWRWYCIVCDIRFNDAGVILAEGPTEVVK